MREIKFRYALKHKVTGLIVTVVYEYHEVFNGLCQKMLSEGLYQDYTVLGKDQYTGLKDRKGEEIFEGDIVRYEMPGPPPEDLMIEYIEPIIFSVASFDVEGAPLYVVNEVCEVIGNIHQQPELLNQ